jgi:hypothetical protein
MVMKGNFIIGVGGHKCASTWISEFLRYHPNVFVTNPKEIHYFTKFYDKGKAWYNSHFLNDEIIQCEFSSDYLYRDDACERIREHFGNDIKILISIREPTSRAISHIKHICRDKGLDVNQVDQKILIKLIKENPDIVNFSKFHDGIKRFQDCFGSNNVIVLSKESLDENSLREMQGLCNFLGVPFADPNGILNNKESIGINPRFKFLELVRQKIYFICYNNFPLGISLVKKMGLSRLYRSINSGNSIVFTADALGHLNKIFIDDWDRTKKNLLKKSF